MKQSEIDSTDLLAECPHCLCADVEMERSESIFYGQDYSERYPREIALQNHGFRARCPKCGCQTCWWHYESEVVDAWVGVSKTPDPISPPCPVCDGDGFIIGTTSDGRPTEDLCPCQNAKLPDDSSGQ